MFGALKKLFGKEEEPLQQPQQPKPAGGPPPQPPKTGVTGVPAQSAAPHAPPSDGQVVEIPYKIIASNFKDSLAPFAKSAPKGNFPLPLSDAVAGLAKGLVTVPFGYLRENAPGEFGDDNSNDNTVITIPIQEVLARVPKSALARNPNQKPVPVPKVGDLFGSRGQPLKPVDDEPAAAHAVAPAPGAPGTPTPVVATANLQPPLSPTPGQIKPSVAPMPPDPKPEAPTLKMPSAPALEPQKPIAPSNLPLPTPKAAPPIAPAVSLAGQTMAVQLNAVSSAWPPAIQQELSSANVSSLHLPLDRVEAALKTGKINFRFAEIRSWAVPALSTPSPMDETTVELPLNVVAPIFMAKTKSSAPRPGISLTDIPDVFSGSKGTGGVAAETAAPIPAAAPAPISLSMAALPASPGQAPTSIKPSIPAAPAAPGAPRPAPNVLGTLFGEAGRTDWPPSEIVKKTAAFKGVSGSVIASHDGLLIAAQVPEPLNADAVAGLLAQVCQKLNQQATELKLNPVTELNVVFGDTTWRIFRLRENYFVVIGKPKEELPTAQLRMIANELGKK